MVLAARVRKKPNCHRDKNGREVQVGLVTQLVVELILLEAGRKALSRSLKRERVRAHAWITQSTKLQWGSQETWGGIESS